MVKQDKQHNASPPSVLSRQLLPIIVSFGWQRVANSALSLPYLHTRPYPSLKEKVFGDDDFHHYGSKLKQSHRGDFRLSSNIFSNMKATDIKVAVVNCVVQLVTESQNVGGWKGPLWVI